MTLRADYRPDRVDRARLMREARLRRYSRFVRFARVVLPVGAVVAIALIFFTGRERAGIEELLTAEELARLGAGLRLDRPRFAGATPEGAPFTLTALSATPDGPLAEEIALDAPEGQLTLEDGRVLDATAAAGMMDRKSERLMLSGGVEIVTSDGYRFETPELTLDFAAKGARAPQAVAGEGPQGSIAADSLTITGAGGGLRASRLYFEGSVRVLFRPEPKG